MVTVEFDSMGEAVRMAGRSAASGMARYPLATVAGRALAGMGGRLETLEEALGSTVVVEYESGGDGGLGRARAPHRRREVRGRRVGALRRMGCRPGRFRRRRDHRLRDGSDGLYGRGEIAPGRRRGVTSVPVSYTPEAPQRDDRQFVL